jgi:menaquinone-dependent protoporphyrinogen IX oxidase
MKIDNLEDLAKELKSTENKNVLKLFEDYAKANKTTKEELEQTLSKEYDCFKCESCGKFYRYDEYSFFDEQCIFCSDTENEEDEYEDEEYEEDDEYGEDGEEEEY